jgi:hypothetical protein
MQAQHLSQRFKIDGTVKKQFQILTSRNHSFTIVFVEGEDACVLAFSKIFRTTWSKENSFTSLVWLH